MSVEIPEELSKNYIVILLPKYSENKDGLRPMIEPATMVAIASAVIGAAMDAAKDKKFDKWSSSVTEALNKIDGKLDVIRNELYELGLTTATNIVEGVFSTYRRDIRTQGEVLINWSKKPDVKWPLYQKDRSKTAFDIVMSEYAPIRRALMNLCDPVEPAFLSYPVVVIGYSYILLAAKLLDTAAGEKEMVKNYVVKYLNAALDETKENSIGWAHLNVKNYLNRVAAELTSISNRWMVVNWTEKPGRDRPDIPRGGRHDRLSIIPLRVSGPAVPYRWVMINGDYASGVSFNFSTKGQGEDGFPNLERGRFDSGSGDMAPAEQHVYAHANNLVNDCRRHAVKFTQLETYVADIKTALKMLAT